MDYFQLFVDKLNEINDRRKERLAEKAKHQTGRRGQRGLGRTDVSEHSVEGNEAQTEEPFDPQTYENPYIPQLRPILDQVLKFRYLHYMDFYPVLLAGKEDETVREVLIQLAPELNHVQIVTDNPLYYMSVTEQLYEEYGLVVEVCHRNQYTRERQKGNLALDFTRTMAEEIPGIKSRMMWIPIYKKRWESRGNLDIAVPIGYNTVIVKGTAEIKEQIEYDRLDREFYLGS